MFESEIHPVEYPEGASPHGLTPPSRMGSLSWRPATRVTISEGGQALDRRPTRQRSRDSERYRARVADHSQHWRGRIPGQTSPGRKCPRNNRGMSAPPNRRGMQRARKTGPSDLKVASPSTNGHHRTGSAESEALLTRRPVNMATRSPVSSTRSPTIGCVRFCPH